MKNIYKLTSAKLGGHFRICYEDGCLTSFEIHFKEPLNASQFECFKARINYNEDNLDGFENLGLLVERETAANEKLAMFCRMYEKYVGIKYKVTKSDSGKIKQVNPEEDLLQHYFTSDNFLFRGKHSVTNLVRYYNELRAEAIRGPASKHPDRWDRDYFSGLKPDQVAGYWKHLRSLGMKPVKNATGAVMDWK